MVVYHLLDDVADAQLPSGAFTDVAPRLTLTGSGAPAWGDANLRDLAPGSTLSSGLPQFSSIRSELKLPGPLNTLKKPCLCSNALAVFAVPLLLMRKTQEAYLRHTQRSAQKLRAAAETIQTQNVSLEQANKLLRERSTAGRLRPGDFDWATIFAGGVRWFHSGGIFAALSATTPEVIIEAMQAAKAAGAVTSFDLNFREKLWKIFGGHDHAVAARRQLDERGLRTRAIACRAKARCWPSSTIRPVARSRP